MRAAERELSAAHTRLYEQLGGFPELRSELPDDVPSELLPGHSQGHLGDV